MIRYEKGMMWCIHLIAEDCAPEYCGSLIEGSWDVEIGMPICGGLVSAVEGIPTCSCLLCYFLCVCSIKLIHRLINLDSVSGICKMKKLRSSRSKLVGSSDLQTAHF